MSEEKEKPSGPTSTAEVALTRMFAGSAQPTEGDRLRALDMTLRAMARDRYTNPQALRPADTVKPVGAVEVKTFGEGRGFIEPKPLPIHSAKGSREEALIDAMAEKFAGPVNGPVKKE